MLKLRIRRNRKDRAPREDYFAAQVEANIAAGHAGQVSTDVNGDITSHVGYNKAGRAYDTRTGRLIKSADLTSHEI